MEGKASGRPRLVILGSGFGAVSLLKRIDLGTHAVTAVSPRNHFLFTPLLPSTTAGTLEFRSVIEPVRKARRGIEFLKAAVTSIDMAERSVVCRAEDGTTFPLPYDVLVIAIGAVNNTFGIPGVEEHALFLKELTDARAIRERVVANLERASLPGLDPKERERLLRFVVVGGGPTGVELAAELNDLFEEDLAKSYPRLAGAARVTLFEAGGTLLTTFDASLRDYTARVFRRRGIEVRLQSPVREVGEGFLRLVSGETVPAGLIVWSTGYGPAPLVRSLALEKDRSGRLVTDSCLRLGGHPGVYALGDCATPAALPLPQTAQVAMQQGKYLAKALNLRARGREPGPFRFVNLGMLAYVGHGSALAEIPAAGVKGHGFAAFLFWRSAYLTRLVSLKGKILVLFDWAKTWLFGRDLSKF